MASTPELSRPGAGIRRLLHSTIGLLRFVLRELGSAAGCFWAGRRSQSAEHLRFALQAVHDDLAMLAAAFRQNAAMPPAYEVTRVLIVKLDRIGDMVNTTPVFDSLRELYPNARLDIVGHPVVLSLLEGDPRLGERFSYRSVLYHGGRLAPPGLAAWHLVRTLWKRRYPLVIYLRGSFPFLLLAGRRCRFVAARFVGGEPVIRRYLKPIGAARGSDDSLPRPCLFVSAVSRNRVLSKYRDWAHGPSVAIHAVSAAEGKQWPLERFARVADEIAVRGQARVLFLATPAEEDKMARLKNLCTQPHEFEVRLRLPEVVGAIALADVFIGNDSGLAHIAAGVNTREVVIWGAADLNMVRPAAKPGCCTVLYRDVPCRAGCPEIRCVSPEHLKCLVDIGEDEVIAAALSQLRSARSAGAEPLL